MLIMFILYIIDNWVHLLDFDVFDVGSVFSESGECEVLIYTNGHVELQASKRVADMFARDQSIEHLIGW